MSHLDLFLVVSRILVVARRESKSIVLNIIFFSRFLLLLLLVNQTEVKRNAFLLHLKLSNFFFSFYFRPKNKNHIGMLQMSIVLFEQANDNKPHHNVENSGLIGKKKKNEEREKSDAFFYGCLLEAQSTVLMPCYGYCCFYHSFALNKIKCAHQRRWWRRRRRRTQTKGNRVVSPLPQIQKKNLMKIPF